MGELDKCKRSKNIEVLIDARDGHGMEARLTVKEEDRHNWAMTWNCWNLLAWTFVSWNGHENIYLRL